LCAYRFPRLDFGSRHSLRDPNQIEAERATHAFSVGVERSRPIVYRRDGLHELFDHRCCDMSSAEGGVDLIAPIEASLEFVRTAYQMNRRIVSV
jgi:hypothetical protein